MKKFKLFSLASLIRGKKSSGCEDFGGWQHWKALEAPRGSNVIE